MLERTNFLTNKVLEPITFVLAYSTYYYESNQKDATIQVNLLFLVNSTGHAVAQLVEAMRYKSEGRGFDSRWCHWNFSLT
jgi:hypothetical protein